MKYILICILALAACVAAGAVITHLIHRRRRLHAVVRVLLTAAFGAGLLLAAGVLYLQVYYHAEPEAAEYLESSGAVEVRPVEQGYFFDGPGEESCLIFFPGAKVEAEAYAPLLFQIAANGGDCFLAEVPFRMAMFGSGAADELIGAYDYDEWILAGHSLGGTVAAGYAAAHPQTVQGLLLLAAYPTKEIPDGMRFLSVYGSEDGCLNRAAYEEGREFWPEDAEEVILNGGNHAQFGEYGAQRGDHAAGISAQEQRTETADAVTAWLADE